MKRLFLLIYILLSVFNVANSKPIEADTEQNNDSTKFDNWTDEQYRQYEDSIISVLYPPVVEYQIDSATITLPDPPVGPAPVSPVPPTIIVDRTKEVGQIVIKSGTTPSGAKTYQVPIEVYPGINGFQPNIAISYNSQQGNSIIGKGWNLSGLSAITRSGKTIYYDKKPEGIRMNNDDSFYLDGVRLICLEKNDEYRLYESERGNIKVKGYTSDNTIKYFEAFYPDGKKGIFGNSLTTNNDLVYPLTQIRDIHGNAVSYTYLYTDNHYQLTKIQYGRCSLLFDYIDNRPDSILSYAGGIRMSETKLLHTIVCRLNAKVLGTYTLDYSYDNYVSLLSSINYSSGDKSYNPLYFYYGKDNDTFSFTPRYTHLTDSYKPKKDEPYWLKIVRGKFDYDSGDDGIISLPNMNPYWKYTRKGKQRFDNLYDGDEKIFIYTGLTKNFETPLPNITTEKGFIDILCADLKGDQNEDIIKINNTVVRNSQQHTIDQYLDRITFKVYRRDSILGLTTAYTRTFDFPTVYVDNKGNKSVQPKFYYTGDFNGDGKMEILAISAHHPLGENSPASNCYIFDLEGNKTMYSGGMYPFKYDFVGTKQTNAREASNNSDKFFVFDYDGDGKTDLCLINEHGISIYTFDLLSELLLSRLVVVNRQLTKADLANREIMLGEFNGDGLADLLISPLCDTDSRQWIILNSKGDGTFDKNIVECTVNSSLPGTGFVIQDLNGDGLTDLIQYDVDNYLVYFARNNAFTVGINSFQNIRYSIPVPLNVSSKSSFGQLVCLSEGLATRYVYSDNRTESALLTGMVNSNGVLEKNTYRFINDDSNPAGFYYKDKDVDFPYVNLSEPISVIAKSEVEVNGQSVDRNEFRYRNAVLHRQGRGFCGFSTMLHTNRRGQTTVLNFDPYSFGTLICEDSPAARAEYTYSVNVADNKIAKLCLTNKSEYNKLTGISTATSYQYDSLGYPVREQISYSDGLNIVRTNTYSSSTEVQTGYNLGFLTDQSATITRNGGTYTERVLVQEHNKRLPLKTIYYKDGNQIKQETNTYNIQGCTLTKTVQLYSSPDQHTTTYAYDPYGRIKKTVDPLGCSSEFTYDRLGQLLTTTDSRGNTTTYGYDSFGRETTVTYPDGTKKTTRYLWADESAPGLYTVSTSMTGEPTVCTVYDALNREVRSSEVRFDNSVVNVDRQYDNNNNLWKVSLPFTGNSASAWDIHEYDEYNRITSLKKASGRTSTYAYWQSSVSVTDNDVTITRDYDAEGNLISVTDPNGTISYTLAADGQTSSIRVLDNIVTTFGYDKYRRQTSLNDPSKGTTVYTYDSAGNVASETNANSQVIQNQYDIHNRLIRKTTPEFATAYTYNEYGDITAVSSDNGTAKTFGYDEFGRTKSVRESAVDGKWLQKDYTYADGNISAVKYTTHLGVLASENCYYTNGHLSEVRLNDRTSVYKLKAENVFGQPTELQSGKITRRYTFTDYGLPTGRKAESASVVYQDFSYTFDPHKPNLLSRKDKTRNINEDFVYDGFDRLTGFGNETVAYDEKGNITEKSDVGTYEYARPDKPYAVTDVLTAENAVSVEPQNITYTSFLRPNRISEGDITAQFAYNAAADRVKMSVTDNDKTVLVRYYLGNCYELEIEGNNSKETLYLSGDYYSAPAALVKYSIFADTGTADSGAAVGLNGIGMEEPSIDFDDTGEDMPNSELYFIMRDYLGSITHIVSASTGKIVQELSYDAWGRLRDPATQQIYPHGTEPPLFLGRGFTGHEHLPWFGLINMNARLYDPVLGRFLSPDPFVQNFDWLQNYNRYSYALNNPLCYIDEDGQFFWAFVGVAAAIGGVVNFATHWDEIASAGGWNAVFKGANYFLSGAVAGGAGAVVSIGVAVGFGSALGITAASYSAATMGFMSGATQGVAGGFTSGFLLGTSNSLIEGKGLLTSLNNGLSEGLSSGISGGILSGVFSGINAVRNGKNFWTGSGTNRNRDRIISEILSEEPATTTETVQPSTTTASSTKATPSTDKVYSIYEGYQTKMVNGNEETTVKYVGITGRDPQVRFNEHLRSGTIRATLKFDPVENARNLLDARIREQMKINEYGLKNLYNKRNEITPKDWGKFGIVPP